MKNFLGTLAFLSMLFLGACTQETAEYIPVDDTEMAANELLAMGSAGGGNGSDSTRGPGGHGGDRGGFGDKGKGHFDHPTKSKGDSIGFAQLPTAAQTYLTTNKLQDSVVRVIKLTMPDGTVRFGVSLKSHKHLFFDEAGALLPTPNRDKAFMDITYDALPTAIKTYLVANTDITKITNIVQITLSNGTIQYGVRTSTNAHFLFDATGNLIKKRG